MSGRLTWGGAVVTGLAGFATGLLVAALLIAGRTPPKPVEFTGPGPGTTARQATVTVTGVPPPVPTVTQHLPVAPQTTTRYVEVTVSPPASSPRTTTITTTSTTSGPWQY